MAQAFGLGLAMPRTAHQAERTLRATSELAMEAELEFMRDRQCSAWIKVDIEQCSE